MTIILNQTLQERSKESLISFINTHQPPDVTIALAESDKGVIANGGRLGSRWAAQSVLCQMKKMAAPQSCPYIKSESICRQKDPFIEARTYQANRLKTLLKSSKKLLHLGGGHDHVYSLLKSVEGDLAVINIDAHLDTRADSWSHSGNPFREFAQQTSSKFDLYQIGIHPFANSISTHQNLANGEMHILHRKSCGYEGEIKAFWNKILSRLTDHTTIIFSLDLDALSVDCLKAVSAPNHNGLSLDFLRRQIEFYKMLCHERCQKPIWGIYEFNPLYDDLSGSGARVVSGIIYEMLLA